MSTYRASSATEQFSRTFTLLAWYLNNPGAGYTEASQALGIPVVQIKKELRELTLCGLPGHDMGSLIDISLDRFGPTINETVGLGRPMNLSPVEAGVLLFHLESIRGTLPEELRPVVESTKEKLQGMATAGRARKDAQLHHGHENGHRTSPSTDYDAVTTSSNARGNPADASDSRDSTDVPSLNLLLEQAIKERREITVVYHSLSSDTFGERILRPDALGAINGHYYLWARPGGGSSSSEVRTFSLERTQLSAEVIDGRRTASSIFGEPGSAGPKAEITFDSTDPFGINNRYDHALLSLSPHVLWMVEYYPMEEVGETDDGRLLVRMPDTGEWLTRFLVSHSDSVSVVEPVSLSDRIRRRALEGLEAYSRLQSHS